MTEMGPTEVEPACPVLSSCDGADHLRWRQPCSQCLELPAGFSFQLTSDTALFP